MPRFQSSGILSTAMRRNGENAIATSSRWKAAWITLPLLFVAFAGCRTDRLVVTPAANVLPADGRRHRVAVLRRKNDGHVPASSMEGASSGLQFEQDGAGRVAVFVRSPVLAGFENAHFFWHNQRYVLPLRFSPAVREDHGDGLPDALHLHSAEDRQAFRAWFVAIAEQEATLPGDKVPPEIDDCAALLRYAYREALMQHDSRWFAAQPEPERFMSLVSISQYHYPETPLGLGLFRVKPGSYDTADPNDGAFGQFADAHTLLTLNAHWIGRDLRAALPGDLLFFRQLEQNSPYHSMIVAGAGSDWVIYHTGPIDRHRGEIRRVAMQDLLHHPDARWHPVQENTNFLGVYRWDILRDGD
jgi:uncharacterized protein